MPAHLPLAARLPRLLSDDRALLARFADERDEPAFAALVGRHGGMVFGVCRRAVGDLQLAEDAFQTVFLVLARNPGAALRSSSVAGWLFGVAHRVGMAARRHELRRRRREQRVVAPEPPRGEADFAELMGILHSEVAALPDAERAAVVACFLREKTQDEAARELGWSLSTLRRRLDRGKELLRGRLTRCGLTLGAGLLAGSFAPASGTAAPSSLVERTVGLARPDAVVPVPVASLAGHALGPALWTKALPLAAGLVVAVGVALGVQVSRPPAWSVESPGPAGVPTERAITFVAAPLPRPEWGVVTGRIVYPGKGPVPAARELPRDGGFVKDAGQVFAGGKRQFFEDLLVNPENRGIRNAVVWLRPDSDDPKEPFPADRIHPTLRDAKPRQHKVTTGQCQFTPRVTIARAGDTLLFENTSPVADNVRYDPTAAGGDDRMFNVLLRAEGSSYTPPGPLPAMRLPDHFGSSIHTWMKGFVWAFDHPYAAVTDENGGFAIPNAPAGEWRLVVWHERSGFLGGAAGRLGTRITIRPGGAAEVDRRVIPLESDGWAVP